MRFETCIGRLRQSDLLVEGSASAQSSFDRLVIDSRDVGSSDCFVALKGTNVDGHLFIDKAVLNGAIAIVCESGPAVAGPDIALVKDSRRALAELASLMESDPASKLKVFAVTGTNGKTTVATLVAHVLDANNHKSGFIGTTGYRDGTHFYEAVRTTPSTVRVYELLGQMLASGCSHCSMELSSHAIDQDRIRMRDVDVALFTNLTRDHLDYHSTFELYFAAKKKLFDELPDGAVAVVNVDDPRGKGIAADTTGSVITFGSDDHSDVSFSIEGNELSGLDLTIDGHRRRFQLAGTYNASNLAAAYAASRALGLSALESIDALSSSPPVEGRFERMQFEGGTMVIVDYAHTPDALKNVLEATLESMRPGSTLWCIFGCGGDRDPGKRAQMGAIAERLAHKVIVTSDNPRTEDPKLILDDIRQGLLKPEDAFWEIDRRDAISRAAASMVSGDTLVLAGKGHETYQVIGTTNIHFDDREEARLAFSAELTSSKRTM
uniref:Putative Mur ligase family, catalytic domain protein n=1 Tax=uncultured marine microorganism HF4000_APKG2M17 TaxID=455548 RepID=B3T6U2_9ZZZZ|nr:putative Mur ligase family, catalytic domain protein [uncultured marine microorganism HF4000_APKG2M17]